MKKLLFLFLLALPVLLNAQDKGIHFEHGLSWEQLKAKAKKENKHIFVDFFTTWCGPCKYMSKEIFTQESVGNLFNDKFINVKIQLDKTDKDNEEVKSWHATGEQLAKEYSVNAYPTFMFFNPEGEPVHRIVGGSETAEIWNQKATAALDPNQQYYTAIRKFKAGNRDPQFLKNAAIAALRMYDNQNADLFSSAYLDTQKDLYTKDNLEFLAQFARTSKSTGFKILLKEPAKVNAVLGEGEAQKIIKQVLLQEEVFAVAYKDKEHPHADWKAIGASLKQKYPGYADEVLAHGQVIFYMYNKDFSNFEKSITSFMQKYGKDIDPMQLNQFAWTVFENCKDMSCVIAALEWSKRSMQAGESPMFMDTYANLLHKAGRTKEAIEWQEKAIAKIPNDKEKVQYQQTLDKMKKGEKTWVE